MIKKGIILAGGNGTRLRPLTYGSSKQLLPVYDKPMIYYPLSVLMLADIRDVLIITKKGDKKTFRKLLGDGKNIGIKITYKEQSNPIGLPDAFRLGKNFIKDKKVMLILGDNFFYGNGLTTVLDISKKYDGCTIFLKEVINPSNFGVAKIKAKKIIKLVEKPKKFLSNNAITGIYIFDEDVVKYTSTLKLSKRNELEIIDLIKIYLKKNKLNYVKLGRGMLWQDNGKIEDLHEASNFVKSLQNLQNILIGSIEEIALKKSWVKKKEFKNVIKKYKGTQYYKNLNGIL
jgi:glucose-1-phosphate thymidylyltransferase